MVQPDGSRMRCITRRYSVHALLPSEEETGKAASPTLDPALLHAMRTVSDSSLGFVGG